MSMHTRFYIYVQMTVSGRIPWIPDALVTDWTFDSERVFVVKFMKC